MAFVQLFIPSEIARSTVSALGEVGAVEFLDVPLPAPPKYNERADVIVEWECKCLPTQLCQGNPSVR